MKRNSNFARLIPVCDFELACLNTSPFAFNNIPTLTNKSESLNPMDGRSYHVKGMLARINMPTNIRRQKRSNPHEEVPV